MRLAKAFLARHFKVIQGGGGLPLEISSIVSHSQKAGPGALFAAIKGGCQDGHDFIPEACRRGASAILIEEGARSAAAARPSALKGFPGLVLEAPSSRKALSLLLNQFYDFPSRRLFSVAFTGSNGKTTSVYLTRRLLEGCGWRSGLVSSVESRCGPRAWPARLTTPEPVELFQRLSDFTSLQARACVMEASSIGLHQGRLEGIDFDIAVFMNLSRDHLDYHKTEEEYFQAKKLLFKPAARGALSGPGRRKIFLVNQDDRLGQRLAQELSLHSRSAAASASYAAGAFAAGASASPPQRLFTFGAFPSSSKKAPDFSFHIQKEALEGSHFIFRAPQGQREEMFLPLAGAHNVENAAAALAVARIAGFKLKSMRKALAGFSGAPGRLQRVSPSNSPFAVFVDYAHTPEALRAVLKALRPFKGAGRLILVFGCGGERDRGKRPLMAKIALQLADQAILTADNPRSEPKERILKDCLQGIASEKLVVEWNRASAIKKALKASRKGDIAVIAGKGHEEFQIVGDKRLPFSDRKEAWKFFKQASFRGLSQPSP